MTRHCIMCVVVAVATICFINAKATAQHWPQTLPQFYEEDVTDRFARWLHLDGAQLHAVMELHRAYVDEWTSFPAEQAAAAEAVEHMRSLYFSDAAGKTESDRPLTMAVERAYEACDRLTAKRLAVEQRFIAGIAALLRDEQQPFLTRVSNYRDRTFLRLSPAELPIATVDIFALTEPLSDEELAREADRARRGLRPERAFVLSGHEYRLIEGMLQHEEHAYVAAVRACAEARRDAAPLNYEQMDIQRWMRANDVTAADRPDLQEKREFLNGEHDRLCVGPSKQLDSRVRSLITSIQATLEPDRAAAFERAVLAEAYPKIWPDRGASGPMLAATLRLDDLSEENRARVEHALAVWEREHRDLSNEMRENVDIRRLARLEHGANARRIVADHRDDFDELQEQRNTLNERHTKLLNEILTSEQFYEVIQTRGAHPR